MTREQKIKGMMDFFGISRAEAIIQLIDSGDIKE